MPKTAEIESKILDMQGEYKIEDLD